jgi:hypothetical protein
MSVTLGDMCPSYSTVKGWVAGFRSEHLNTEDEDRFGRPTRVTIPENVDAIHCMILDDRGILANKIAKTLTLSRERVDCIIR